MATLHVTRSQKGRLVVSKTTYEPTMTMASATSWDSAVPVTSGSSASASGQIPWSRNTRSSFYDGLEAQPTTMPTNWRR